MTQYVSDDYLANRVNSILDNHPRTAFIGLGNPVSGDDGVGIYISDKLLELTNSINPFIISCYNTPVNYLGKIVKYNPDFIVFIDALYHPDFAAGDIVIVSPGKIKEVDTFTTHYQSYDTVIKFLETELDKKLDFIILGVNVTSVEMYEDISIEIEDSAEVVIASIEGVINNAR